MMLTFAFNTAKAVVGQTAGISAQIKAVMTPNYTSAVSFTAIRWQLTNKQTKKPVLLNVLDEAVKITLTKSQPLNTCLSNIPCDEMGRVHKAILRAAGMKIALRESTVIELQGELATSSWNMTKRKTMVI